MTPHKTVPRDPTQAAMRSAYSWMTINLPRLLVLHSEDKGRPFYDSCQHGAEVVAAKSAAPSAPAQDLYHHNYETGTGATTESAARSRVAGSSVASSQDGAKTAGCAAADLDALIGQLEAWRDLAGWADGGWDLLPAATAALDRMCNKAAAALRDKQATRDLLQACVKHETHRAEQAEAALAAEKERVERMRGALLSIAANTCCDTCREAANVARTAIADEDKDK